jgi:hypothetical protein
MPDRRTEHAASLLHDGRVLVTGGCWSCRETADLYDPATNTWTEQPPMITDHGYHTSTTLPDGRVVVAGGLDNSAGVSQNSVEIFTPPAGSGQGSWLPGPSLVPARAYHVANSLDTGDVLFTGGLDDADGSVEIPMVLSADGTAFTATATMTSIRAWHTVTRLTDGSYLATGGWDEDTSATINTAEIYTTSVAGGACTVGAECASGFCADGVCCDVACDEPCLSCLGAEQEGGADGTCGPKSAGESDLHCEDEGVLSCGMTGVCDGAGTCELYAAGSSCGPSGCSDGMASMFRCNGQGGCVLDSVDCSPYACASADACAESCTDHEHCQASAWCSLPDGTCEPKSAPGEPCSADVECPGAACVDGACAESGGCTDDVTLELATGELVACAPYRCAESQCLTSCRSVLDCAPGLVCNADGVCLASSSQPPESSGGCAIGPSPSTRFAPIALASLALLIAAAARRRRRSA